MFKVTNSKKFKQREQYFSGKDFMLRKSASITSNFIVYIMTLPKARRTLELTAELSGTFPKGAVQFSAIFGTRAIGAEYSTC